MPPRILSSLFAAALAPLLVAGCGGDSHERTSDPGDGGLADAAPMVPDASPMIPDAAPPDGGGFGPCQGDSSPSKKLDILFLVDNSHSMGQEQVSLTQNFPVFMSVLRNIPGGTPDLHIGVISSNMGVGGWDVPHCGGNGDDGQLQATARTPGCAGPIGNPFIIDEAAPSGSTRVTNYSGTLEDTFACIAQLGTEGCGFEQHLASLQRALDPSNTFNAGFLRPDAYLAVIIMADEDDCSAADPAIYDPGDTSPSGTLGPLESFRCTEFGVTCDEGNISRAAGDYTGCRPRTDSYLRDPEVVADFLKSIKCDPNKLLVAGILGNADPVGVRLDGMGHPRLNASCASDSNGTADPAVRTSWLLQQLPGSVTTSICHDDLSGALVEIATRLAGSVGGH